METSYIHVSRYALDLCNTYVLALADILLWVSAVPFRIHKMAGLHFTVMFKNVKYSDYSEIDTA